MIMRVITSNLASRAKHIVNCEMKLSRRNTLENVVLFSNVDCLDSGMSYTLPYRLIEAFFRHDQTLQGIFGLYYHD